MYDQLKAKLDSAEKRLMAWDAALRDPKKFGPGVKGEWDRAFDAHEDAEKALCRADPRRFQIDYPDSAWLAVYLGLLPASRAD